MAAVATATDQRTDFSMTNLTDLLNSVKVAKQKFDTELLRQYPVNSKVLFKIMDGQKNLSSGIVICAGHNVGHLRVLHLEAKERSRYRCRDIHYSMLTAAKESL